MICIWCLVCSRFLINNSLHFSSPPIGLLDFPLGSLGCCQCQERLINPISGSWSNKVWVFFSPWFSGAQEDFPEAVSTLPSRFSLPCQQNCLFFSVTCTLAATVSHGCKPMWSQLDTLPLPISLARLRTVETELTLLQSLPKVWTAVHFKNKVHFLYKSKD